MLPKYSLKFGTRKRRVVEPHRDGERVHAWEGSMSLVNRLTAQKHIRTLKRAGSAEDNALAEAKQQLIAAGEAIIGPVIDLLDDAGARPHAVEVLCQVATDATVPLLVEALASESTAVVNGIVEVLSTSTGYRPQLLLEYLELPGRTRGHIETILGARGASIPSRKLVSSLIEINKESRPIVFRLLESHARPEMAGSLLDMLHHEDWWVRLHALKVLSQLPSDESIKGAIAMLKDASRNVRLEAVEALGRLDGRVAIPELCQVLRDTNLKVQSAAIDVLVKFNDVSAVAHLLEVLKDEAEQARRGAVEVLNAVATTAAIKDLVVALQDADWWVQARAADALGTLGGPRVVEAVLGLMDHTDCHVRRYAIEILNSIPDPRASQRLIQALDDPDWWVRERAIDALAKTGDPQAVEPLIRLFQSDGRAAPLCARALGALGDPRAIEALSLAAAAGDMEIRKAAIEGLHSLAQAELPDDARRCVEEILSQVEGVRATMNPRGTGAPLRFAPPGRPGLAAPPPPGLAQPDGEATLQRGRSRIDSMLAAFTPSGTQPAGSPEDAARTQGTQAQQGPTKLEPTRLGSETVGPGRPVPGVTLSEWAGTQGPSGLPTPGVGAAGLQDLRPGTMLLNRYRVIRRIGSGGFGTVYLVSDVTVEEELILKVLSPHISVDPLMIKRFVHELKYARRVTHLNIIRIHDLLQFEGGHAISMEFFPGKDLGTILTEEGRMDVGRVLHIAHQVCEGLAAAHAQGVIHRDIKPANIMVGEQDLVKIVDFGLAAMTQSAGSRLTKSGILIGTPQYMAPEQIKGDDVDGRADIYSLGVMMYEMLSGRQPFCGDNAVNILYQHLEGQAQPLSELVPGIPPEVERLVACFMARHREERPPDIAGCLEWIDGKAA